MRQKLNFSLFYLPVLRSPNSAYQLYDRILREIAEADKLGWHGVWLSEHHFDTYGGVLPSASLFGAAVAMRTQNIRIGTGIAVLPLRNGLQLAEEMAMLDVLSKGRVNIGLGRGFMPHEFRGFGVTAESRQERFEEGLAVLLAALRGERFSYVGKYYHIEDAQLFPFPLQQPYPPIWIAASLNRRSFEIAGQHGFHLMLNPYTRTKEELAQGIRWYRAALKQNGHNLAEKRILVHHHLFIALDEVQAREVPREHLLAYLGEVDRAYGKGTASPSILTPQSYEMMYPDRVMFGTPEAIENKIKAWTQIGVTDFCFMIQFGDLSPVDSMTSLHLFSQHVIPRLS